MKNSKSAKKSEEDINRDDMNTTAIKPIKNKTNSLKEVLETNPSNIKETDLPGTDELEQLGNDTI